MKTLRFRQSCVAALAVILAGGAAAVEFPSVVDGVLTLDCSENETYDQALSAGISRLVKSGSGEAVLTAASPAFNGVVEVKEGTLTLKDAASVGADTKIEVTGDAATLHLNFARPADAGDVFFAGHDVTIRGRGVDGKGAFRYTDPDNASNAQDDRMLESLTLSDDAAISVPTRFGIGRALNLNGHVLTRVDGSGNWMWNSADFKVDGGVISNLVGNIVWQQDPTFAEPERTRLCMDAGTLTAWHAKTLPCAVIFNGGALRGSGETENSLAGPVTVLKSMEISQNGVAQCTRFSGIVTCDVSKDDQVSLTGSGIHYFDGPFATTGSFFLKGGVASVGSDFRVGNLFRLPQTGASVLRQTAGRLEVTSPGGWITYIGEQDGSYGRYVMTGGTTAFAGAPVIGVKAGACGLFWQEGGAVESPNGVDIGRGGCAFLGVVAGAKFKAKGADAYALPLTKLASQSGGSGVLAVSGEGSTFEAGSLALGAEDGSLSASGVVVADGGVLKAGRLYCPARTSGEDAVADVYFDGGVLMPTRWRGFRLDKASPRHWKIGPKGMVVDLSELRGNSAEDEMTRETELVWRHPLSDLSGRGLASVSLPTENAAFDAEAYLGPVFVDVEGPSGSHGAVAIAECDAATRKLTRVRVLAPGNGYDETTQVYVHSADGQMRYACGYALTEANRAGGRLVKRGDRTLCLCGTNSYTGGTVVEEGVLVVEDETSFPSGTPLKVMSGAAFKADGQSLSVSTLSGAGGTIACGDLTVTKGLEISVAELFAADGPLTVAAAMSFADGVSVKIVDPENLEAHAQDRSRVVLRVTGGLAGAVPVLSGEVCEKWFLAKSGNTLKFGPRRGACLIIR